MAMCIIREGLNPLAVLAAPERFSVAAAEGGALAGFGQLRSLAPGQVELASLVVLPEYR